MEIPIMQIIRNFKKLDFIWSMFLLCLDYIWISFGSWLMFQFHLDCVLYFKFIWI